MRVKFQYILYRVWNGYELVGEHFNTLSKAHDYCNTQNTYWLKVCIEDGEDFEPLLVEEIKVKDLAKYINELHGTW